MVLATSPASRLGIEALAWRHLPEFEVGGVDPSQGQEFSVRAHLHDLPLDQNDDAVGVLDGGQAVRNHQCGSAHGQAVECFLHESLRLVVQGRGGFIEQ